MHSRTAPSLPLLIFMSAVAVLPVNMFVPSLPAIAREFAVDFALVNMAVAGYAMATAVVHLVAGALSDRWGRRPVALAAFAVFTLASVGCALAGDITSFLLFRLLQGSVIAGYAVSLAVIRDTSDEYAAASRVGYVSSAWAVAPMVGPALGGVLDMYFGWRASFALFALLGLAGLWLIAFRLNETHLQRTATVAAQFRGYRAIARSARFWAHALCMAFSIAALYLFLGGAPLVATQFGGISSAQLGLYMGLVPSGFMVGSYLVGRLSARYPPMHFILAGRLLVCAGLTLGLVLEACGLAHPLAFFAPCICLGLGNGLTMPAANARVLSLGAAMAGGASGMAAALTLAGAGSMAFAGGLLINASNAHLAVLGLMLASSGLSLAAALWARARESMESAAAVP